MEHRSVTLRKCHICKTRVTCFLKGHSRNKDELLELKNMTAEMKDSLSGLEGEVRTLIYSTDTAEYLHHPRHRSRQWRHTGEQKR